jgi:glycosyltransferase involved in cell wall biosynthesis
MQLNLGNRRVAVVHDWLVTHAGAERVLAHILDLAPLADVFTLVDFLPEPDRAQLGLQGRRVTPSWIQRSPGAQRHFRKWLPLLPHAIERFDLSGYDVVLSSSHAFAKGVRKHPSATHVCYCYTPMRYAWAMTEEYLTAAGPLARLGAPLARAAAGALRRWDRRNSARVDAFAACSRSIQERIQSAYSRPSTVIYPPVDVSGFQSMAPSQKQAHYITVARLVPYKRVDLIIDAFRELREARLIVIGTGPEHEKLQRTAPPNVHLAGFLPTHQVQQAVAEARAFIFAADEDFGIAPVEAQAAGTPVIALGRGGTAETVVDIKHSATPTGVLFAEQSIASLVAAIKTFERHATAFTADHCQANAWRFRPDVFRHEYAAFVNAALAAA